MSVKDLDVTVQLIGLVVSLIALGGAIWLIIMLRRSAALRFRARRNRRRHPDLTSEYMWADEGDRFLVAQRMMMRDRDRLRLADGSISDKEKYPDIWDYYIPPGVLGVILAQSRQEARQVDLERIREKVLAK